MRVRELPNVWVPLSDGCRLGARIWLPEGAPAAPVPAILEYLPYRKDDETANADATRHPYFARHGYAAVRVDIRGTGDSDGVIVDEYTRQEQLDALDILTWLADQPWCTGQVGMIGYSWGGFNGLQVAAHRPPQLKAVVSGYSADDRYADDCHYMGGCLLGSDMLKWATSMRAYNALPPDPRFRDDWLEVWLERLASTPAFIESWLTHQTRDEFWRQGSIAEDYSAITAATLLVGGWADAYTNAVPRMLEHLGCPRRGLIGPWAHFLPYLGGEPGPRVGFLQECLRWFDRYLKGIDTGVDADPLLRAWVQESVEPSASYHERPGRWVGVDSWPPGGAPARGWRLSAGGVLAPGDELPGMPSALAVSSPQHLGETAGVWCANGRGEEFATDQRSDDALSACFDTEPLAEPMEVLGFPEVRLVVSADKPFALVAARLCEVAPDGASTLVSWGLLNLARREGHDRTAPLEPGHAYEVALKLNAIGHRFSAGNRLRLALSPTYWPHAWPSPESATLSVEVGGQDGLSLPILDSAACVPASVVAQPESTPRLDPDASSSRTRERSIVDGRMHRTVDVEHSSAELPDSGTRLTSTASNEYSIVEGDPLSPSTTSRRDWRLERDGWSVRIVVSATMGCDAGVFVVDDSLEAYHGDERVFSAKRRISVERDGV